MVIENQTLLVLGTSRSGTSIAAALLQLLGGLVQFDHAIGNESQWYPEYETESVFLTNSKAMGAHGHHWNSMVMQEKLPRGVCYAPLTQNWSNSLVTRAADVAQRLRVRANHNLLNPSSPPTAARAPMRPAGSNPRGSPVLIKDPRFCWTLDLWTKALDTIGWPPPVLVLVERNPIEVAISLNCREKYVKPIAHWEGTMRLLLKMVQRVPASSRRVVVVHATQMLSDPRRTGAVLLKTLTGRMGVRGLAPPSEEQWKSFLTNMRTKEQATLPSEAGGQLNCEFNHARVRCLRRDGCNDTLTSDQLELARGLLSLPAEAALSSDTLDILVGLQNDGTSVCRRP